MNLLLWTLQGLLALAFLYSGGAKSTLPAARLVALGQTGVADLPRYLIRFIGVSEVLGALGLVLPWASGICPVLTPLAAAALGLIMLPAAAAHYARREYWTMLHTNAVVLVLCAVVAYGRFSQL